MRKSHQIALVTGASGFIGANLVRILLESFEVHIFTRKDSNRWRIQELIPKLKEHTVDFQDLTSLTQEFKDIQPDIIFHLASFGGYPFQTDPLTIVQANIIETFNLLEASKTTDYKLFINVGSSSEYGYKRKPMKETDQLEPTSIYAATKAGATHIASAYYHVYQKPIMTIRPFSVYGPFEEPTRFIPQLILSCLNNQDIKLTQGNEGRDFIYIDDFIDGMLKFCRAPKEVKGKIINLGTGQQHSIKEVANLAKELTGSSSKLLWRAYKPRDWDTDYWVADNKLALSLGWQPKFTLQGGLEETINWFKKNKHLYL